MEYGDFVLRCRRLIATHRALAKVQVVHVHTLPDFLLWAALPARRRGARVVFDMHEIFPEFARAKFPGPIGRVIAAIAGRVERWARRRADLTITVNRPIDELLKTRPASATSAGSSSTTRPTRAISECALRTRGLPEPIRLVYHGTLTHMYGLDIAIRGVAREPDGRECVSPSSAMGRNASIWSVARTEAKPGTVVVEKPITHACWRAASRAFTPESSPRVWTG